MSATGRQARIAMGLMAIMGMQQRVDSCNLLILDILDQVDHKSEFNIVCLPFCVVATARKNV